MVGAAVTPWALLVPGRLPGRASPLGSLPAGRGLPFGARLRIPLALATMHMCWGYGFLTSPRSLARRVIASRRPAAPAGERTDAETDSDTAVRAAN